LRLFLLTRWSNRCWAEATCQNPTSRIILERCSFWYLVGMKEERRRQKFCFILAAGRMCADCILDYGEAPYRLTPGASRRGLDPHERLTSAMLPMGRSNTNKLWETQCTESDYCLAMRIRPDSKTRLKHRASPPKRTNLIGLNIQRSPKLLSDFFLGEACPQLTQGECASSIVQDGVGTYLDSFRPWRQAISQK